MASSHKRLRDQSHLRAAGNPAAPPTKKARCRDTNGRFLGPGTSSPSGLAPRYLDSSSSGPTGDNVPVDASPEVPTSSPPVSISNAVGPAPPVATVHATAPLGARSRDQPATEEPFGLKVLFEGVAPVVDLVAVHGLDGHWEDTWTAENGVLWLRDCLPEEVPNVRIFTYGYDGRTHDTAPLSCQSLHDYALDLVTSLCLERKRTNTLERPIIFIAHSIGGIIVKDALIHSNSANESNLEHHNAIKTSTCGVLFFGTPHQGTDNISWPQILFNAASAVTKKNEAVLRDLEAGSMSLQKQLAQYNHISSHIETKFFYETYAPEGSDIIVPQAAAVVLGTTNAETFAIHRDHQTLVKYKSRNDAGFKKVSLCILLMVEEAPAKAIGNWERRRLVAVAEKNEGVQITFKIPFKLEYLQNQRFTGRGLVLERIHSEIQANNARGRSTPIVLYGTGGIGKTQIVVEYLYAHRKEYSSIFWVNAATHATTILGFRDAAQRLINEHARISLKTPPHYPTIAKNLGIVVDDNGLLLTDEKHNECIINGMKLWFSMEDNRNWLLVFDNVDDLDTVKIDTFMPSPAAGTIIMTSRRTECVHFGTGIEVKEMSEEEGVVLLSRTAGLHDNAGSPADPIVLEVTKKLGSLPLALAQAGAFVAARQIPLKKYLEIYDVSFERAFGKKLPVGVWTYGDRSILTTWEITFQAIREESPDAARLLSVCSFLFHEIREDMLYRGKKVKLGESNLDKSLELLYSYSLAQPQRTDGAFYIHSVVHRWAQERLENHQRIWCAKQAVVLVATALEYSGHRMSQHVTYESAIMAHTQTTTTNIQKYLSGEMLDGLLVEAISSLAMVHYHWGQWKESEILKTLVAKELGRSLGENNPVTTAAKGNLAATYSAQGRSNEAEKLKLHVMEAQKRTLGNEHPDTLRAISNLAATYFAQGRSNEAEKLNLHVMEARKRTLGNEHPDTLRAISNLAVTYSAQGRENEAEKLKLHVMEAQKRTLGNEHPDTLVAISNLAATYSAQGWSNEAEKLNLHVMEARKRTLGNEHPDTLRAISNLAATYSAQGRSNEAEKLKLHVMEAQKRTLGKDHPHTQTSKRLFSQICRDREVSRVEDIELQLAIITQNQGPDHPDALVDRAKLAEMYDREGRTQDAEKQLLQLMNGRKNVLGSDHPDTISTISSLALTYSIQERWEEAEELGREVVGVRKRVLGCDDPQTLSAMVFLASTFWNQDRWEEAEELEMQVVKSRRSTLGRGHPDTLSAMASLAVSYRMQGQYGEAEQLQQEVMWANERRQGSEHPDTISAMANLASTYKSQGRSAEAEELEKVVMETRQRQLGSNRGEPEDARNRQPRPVGTINPHPNTLEEMHDLMMSYIAQSRIDDIQQLAFRTEERLGSEHPVTKLIMAVIQMIYQRLGH